MLKAVFPVAITYRWKHLYLLWAFADGLLCSVLRWSWARSEESGHYVWWGRQTRKYIKSEGKLSALLGVLTLWYKRAGDQLRREGWVSRGYFYMFISFKTLIFCFLDNLWITPWGMFLPRPLSSLKEGAFLCFSESGCLSLKLGIEQAHNKYLLNLEVALTLIVA